MAGFWKASTQSLIYLLFFLLRVIEAPFTIMFGQTKALCLMALCLVTSGVHSLATPPAEKHIEVRAEPRYKAVAAAAQKRRQDALDAFMTLPTINESALGNDLRPYLLNSGLLTAAEVRIIKTDAYNLVRRMVNRTLTSVEVTTAFCKATVIAQNLV